MKKTTKIFTTTILITLLSATAFAYEKSKVSQEEKLKVAKKLYKITDNKIIKCLFTPDELRNYLESDISFKEYILEEGNIQDLKKEIKVFAAKSVIEKQAQYLANAKSKKDFLRFGVYSNMLKKQAKKEIAEFFKLFK